MPVATLGRTSAALLMKLEKEFDESPVDRDIAATAEIKAASPPCESTMVVIQLESGSGGKRTRVMIPGTTSAKWWDTNVDIKLDFPTPSVKQEQKNEVRESWICLQWMFSGIPL